MTISNISLSASETANLLALQNISTEESTTSEDLATGNKVNSALDDATAYFTSTGFLNSANDFSNVADGLSTALSTVQAAGNAIDSITQLIQEMQGLTTSALQTTNTTIKQSYATQYNSLLTQITGLVNDASFNGTNLLQSGNNLQINFDESGSASMTIDGIDMSAAGLGLTAISDAWSTNSSIDTSTTLLSSALNSLRANATSFGDNATVIETRETFTSSLITLLETASSNLTVADTNVEGADEQALETRNQLAVDALSISNTNDQAILKLFG